MADMKKKIPWKKHASHVVGCTQKANAYDHHHVQQHRTITISVYECRMANGHRVCIKSGWWPHNTIVIIILKYKINEIPHSRCVVLSELKRNGIRVSFKSARTCLLCPFWRRRCGRPILRRIETSHCGLDGHRSKLLPLCTHRLYIHFLSMIILISDDVWLLRSCVNIENPPSIPFKSLWLIASSRFCRYSSLKRVVIAHSALYSIIIAIVTQPSDNKRKTKPAFACASPFADCIQ